MTAADTSQIQGGSTKPGVQVVLWLAEKGRSEEMETVRQGRTVNK